MSDFLVGKFKSLEAAQSLKVGSKTITNIIDSSQLGIDSAVANSLIDSAFTAKSTNNLSEGGNLYYTKTRSDSDFDANFNLNNGLLTADRLNEGATNLFYTDDRVRVVSLDSEEAIQLIDSAYIQARQVDLQRDSAFITNIVDSAYVLVRAPTQDFLDSSEAIALIDSDYVQARQTSGGIDSAGTTALVDSAYVQVRQIKYTNNDFADSAYVTTQINSVIDAAPGALNTLNELAAALGDDANFSTTITNQIAGKLDSATTTTLIDSAYVQARVTASGNDSATTIDLIDSAYVQTRQITPISSFNTVTVASVDVVADSTGVHWPATAQNQKVTASDAANNDFFGNVVDIDGDYAVVGARGNKAAYILYYNGSAWTEQQKIQETTFGSNFGHSVSISGDTVVIGSNNEDVSSADGTKAYVYTRSGTTWSLQQKVDPSQAHQGDYFGYQKTMKLDKTNNDQFIAGSYGEDETNSGEGAVYIFNRSGTTWSETQRIVPSDKTTNSYFGVSADIAGDYAIFGGNNSVYVYYKSGGTWSQQQKIANPYEAGNGHSGPTNATNFGRDGEISINAAGDTIAVGARGQFNLPGYVFVFTRSGTTWTLQQALRSSNTANDDMFGWSVSLDGLGNSLTVGAKTTSTGGKAYIFTRTGSTWTEVKDLTASDVAANWEFGEGIGISRSNDKIIVGARQYSSSANGQGAAYIFNAGATAKYSDTLTLEAGSNITITTNASTDTVTIAGSAAGNDSATTIALIDSSYVQARQTSGGIDSAATIDLIDSAYIQARTSASGIEWQSSIQTGSSLTAQVNKAYWVDTTSNTVTATLPASASPGDEIIFVDYARTWNTNNFLIDNGDSTTDLKYQGAHDSDATFNTEGTNLHIVYSGATQGWIPINDDPVDVHAVTPLSSPSIEMLVVAGGGGGGGWTGGGGGAGGYRTSTQLIAVGTVLSVTVGGGGAGGDYGNSTSKGTNGSASSITGNSINITSAGGGGGGGYTTGSQTEGASGGSGGGGGHKPSNGSGGSGNVPSVSPSQGNDGGASSSSSYNCGGGGGAGASGSNGGNASSGGGGGAGTSNSITGSAVTYAGGGSGARQSGSANPGGAGGGGNGGVYNGAAGSAGTANTGGGGGGDRDRGASAGGSGVVILKVPTASYSDTKTGNPTVSTSGDYKILKFTGAGSYTV
jgi:hypothetical protein